MASRKWLVRCLVFTISSGLGSAALLYQQWTNPAAVRQQVVEHLGVYFVGANVTLDSAHMKLLGGISLRELRLSRRDDPNKADLLHVPEATVYPDKEQVANGTFSIRKIELHRPHLRIRRGADGRWNVAGILAPPDLSQFIPTIEFRQGRITFEDLVAGAHLPILEINNVSLTIVNDPLPTLQVQGQGATRLADVVRIGGTYQRASSDTTVSLGAEGIVVGQSLIQRLAAYAPELGEHGSFIDGVATLKADLAYHSESSRPWTHHVRWRLERGRLRHPRIPIPLDELRADVCCMDGLVTLEKLTAKSGDARVTMSGKARGMGEAADFQARIRVEHLSVKSDLFAHLPAGLQKINAEYAPSGPVTVDLHVERSGPHESRRCTIRPEDLTVAYHKFPYPLAHVTGSIEQFIHPAEGIDELRIDLVGMAGAERVFIKGAIQGEGPHQSGDIKIHGENIVLDHKLQSALPAPHRKIAAMFHPAGFANFEARIQRQPGDTEWNTHFRIRFHDVTVRYDVFPYPLKAVSGVLDIRPSGWDACQFRGTHNGGWVHANAQFHPSADGDRLTVHLRGDRIALDADLRAALVESELKQAWKSLRPSGHMDFTAQVTRVGDAEPDIQVGIHAMRCAIRPEFFDYQLDDVTGQVSYANRWIHLENIRGRHGRSMIAVDKGRIYLHPDGGVWSNIESLRGEPLIPDSQLLAALPPALRDVCQKVALRDPIYLSTRLVTATTPVNASPPDIYWDGKIEVRDASLKFGVPFESVSGVAACSGRFTNNRLDCLVGNLAIGQAKLFDQPFRDIQGALEVSRDAPDVLLITGLHARVHGGEVYGPVRIEFGARVRYEMDLTASRIQLEQFGRHNLGADSQLSGLAMARLHLEGKGPEIEDLSGRGSIDVPNGRLRTLPPLLDLLKFLTIRLPDGTAFEEAHATFAVQGRRIRVDRVDLFGNSVSLRGNGEMDLDGTNIQMDFFAVWARVTQMLPPIIKDLPHDVSKHLFKIHMTGRINDVHFTKEPVPLLVEPLKGFLERLAVRKNDGLWRAFQKPTPSQ
jgi:hypothetical protein